METATIRLRKPARLARFRCDEVRLERDDHCIVQTDRGQEWGECVLPAEINRGEAFDPEFKVIRKANKHDFSTLETICGEERASRAVCQAKIDAHKLDMKLVDVEYTFDRRKAVFYFIADERVDFRELVRDLAHELRVRIELRHIQVRDQAKMTGGLGCCGRQLCCSSFLTDFKPISMRMAKRQDLSLNPSKISGQCGRLLCCLSYEDEQYGKERKKKPAPALDPSERPCPDCVTKCPNCRRNRVKKPIVSPAPAHEQAPVAEADTQPEVNAAEDGASAENKKRRRRRRGRGGQGGGGTPQESPAS